MAKLNLKNEWKIWAAGAALVLSIVGYLYLVSRPPMEGGEYLWRVTKITDDGKLTLRGSGNIVEARLVGLRISPAQQEAARDFLTKTLQDQWVRLKTVREGPKGIKEAFIYLSGDDINARMIRMGMAELDTGEKGFDVRPYIELEQEAKRQHRGLWKESAQGAK